MSYKSKRKKVIKVRDLEDVNVNFVSLVPTGANQIPFRLKKADDMHKNIDLNALFGIQVEKSENVEDKSTTVSCGGVVIPADLDETRVTEVFKSAGLDVAEVEKANGLTIVKFDTESYDEADTPLKAKNGSVILFKGLMDSSGLPTSFKQNVSSMGFVPNVALAADAFVDTLWNIAIMEEDKSAVAESVDTALNEFSAHIKTLVNRIPVDAFKAEQAVTEILEAVKAGEVQVDQETEQSTDLDDGNKEEKTPEVTEGTDTVATDEGTPEAENEGGAEEAVTKTDDDTTGTIESNEGGDGLVTDEPVIEHASTKKAEGTLEGLSAPAANPWADTPVHVAKTDTTTPQAVEPANNAIEGLQDLSAGEKVTKSDDSAVLDVLKELSGKFDSLANKVEGIETRVAKQEQDLGGTVISNAGAADDVKKSAPKSVWDDAPFEIKH